jgi:hypothetical protein
MSLSLFELSSLCDMTLAWLDYGELQNTYIHSECMWAYSPGLRLESGLGFVLM